MERLWTTAEVARCLNINEQDVEQLVKEGKLTGYKLGGKFLRFRPDQVQGLKGSVQPRLDREVVAAVPVEGWQTRVREALYFYDFYILSAVLLASVLMYLIASSS